MQAERSGELPPRAVVVAAGWWLWLGGLGRPFVTLWRRLRRERGLRVAVRVGAPLVARPRDLERWLEDGGRAVITATRPTMPVGVVVTAEAGTPGGDDLGWVRAAYQVTAGPRGRRAIVWLGAARPVGVDRRVEDWLADGLTWALLRLVNWSEGRPAIGCLPLPGVQLIRAAPGDVDVREAPADRAAPAAAPTMHVQPVAPADSGSSASAATPDGGVDDWGSVVAGVTLNDEVVDRAAGDAEGVGAESAGAPPLTTSAPPERLSYPAEE